MALTPEQQAQAGKQDKTDSVQHGVTAADAFMAVFGLRRVVQKPSSEQMDKDMAMREGRDD